MSLLRTEEEIWRSWKKKDVLVSIICNTFNHEKYIYDAIHGFLIQKTNFALEILVHDDASNDQTPIIIQKYYKKYPNLIKPIFQKENQYSKGIKPTPVFQYPRANGKYIALCEGDDYWIDPFKLQKQVNSLEKNEEIAVCTHEAYHHHLGGPKKSFKRALSNLRYDFSLYGAKYLIKRIKDYFIDNRKFWEMERCHLDKPRFEKNLLNNFSKGDWYMPFCSILLKRELFYPLPDCFIKTGGGHQLTLLWGAINGGVYHMTDIMAVKRDQESSVTQDKTRKKKIYERNQKLSTNNRIKRYECLKKYANHEDKKILVQMMQDYISKRNIVIDNV